MTESRAWRLALAVLLASSAGACALTRGDDDESGRVESTGRGMASAAVNPLRDVGLIRPEIPDVLENIHYPYLSDTLAAGCPAISYEIAQLDAVLGAESYQPGRETTFTERGIDSAGDYVEGYAVGAVRDAVDIVPFRSWVRRLSGAAGAEKRAARAIEMGHTRRTYLRGYGAALGCPDVVPAPPPPESERERRRRERDRDEEQQTVSATPATDANAAATPISTTPAPTPAP